MSRTLAEIQAEIRSLDLSDHERLQALLEELDGPPDPDAERLWLDEIRRRSAELHAGLVQTIPAEEVFEHAQARLRNAR